MVNKLLVFIFSILLQNIAYAYNAYTFLETIPGNTNKEISVDKDLDITVWNLFMLNKINSKKFQKSSLFNKINKSSIILFQEIIANAEYSQRKLGLDDFTFIQIPYLKKESSQFEADSISNGMANISKSKSLNSKIIIADSIDLADGTQSMAIRTDYKVLGLDQDLRVIHIHNGVSIFKTMRLMRKLENEINDHIGPIIVAGDFNSFLYKSRFIKKWAKRNKLIDAKVKTPYKVKFLKVGQLDHAFYRGLELVDNVDILIETKELSDHLGYALKFKFNTED